MPQSGQKAVPANTVTQLSNADIPVGTSVTFQNKSMHNVHVLATTSATPPTAADIIADGIMLKYGQGEKDTLANIFNDGNTYIRLWAVSENPAVMTCYHQ